VNRIKLVIILATIGALSVWFAVHWRTQRKLDIELIQAAFAVDTSKVTHLLSKGADPRARYGSVGPSHLAGRDGGYPMSADMFTALLALAHSDSLADRIPIARALLAAGADINADDGYGDTALAQCCYMNHEALALFLIESGANPNTKTGLYIDGTYNITPAHRATRNYRILQALISHGADLTPLDSAGHSILDWARRENDDRLVTLINEATKK
jgi:hypothetical protein